MVFIFMADLNFSNKGKKFKSSGADMLQPFTVGIPTSAFWPISK